MLRLKSPPLLMQSATDPDQCPLGPDGQLLDASQI